MTHGTEPFPAPVPQPYVTPEADLVVFAGPRGNRHAAVLNTLPDGTQVVAAGMVDEVREHGTLDAPLATLVLVNDFGQAAYAAADSDTLAQYSLFLMDGVEVSLHGVARVAFAEAPKATYIQIVRVEPLFS